MTTAAPPSEQSSAQTRSLTPLLTLITQESLDADYARVARTHPHEGKARGLTIGAVLLVVFGGLVAIAAVQTSRESASTTATRDELISRINARQDQLAQQQQSIADTRATMTDESAAYADLGTELNRSNTLQQLIGGTTGFVDQTGAGLEITVSDSPNGDVSGEVRGSDLANLVNALWSAGAQAIAINDQRVTPLSAPRNSGSVVRMNNVSLSSPYTVVAIGPPSDLHDKVFTSRTGKRFESIAARYGYGLQMTTSQQAHVPAAAHAMLTLTHATAIKSKKVSQ